MARQAERTPYQHRAWPAVRLQVLERDGYVCQIQSPVCTRKATDADHIIPWRDGGAKFALANLRASCSQCNSSRSAHQKHNRGWERSPTQITLVIGLANDSLTDHVNLGGEDVVIDIDMIAQGFGSTSETPGLHAEPHLIAAKVAHEAIIKAVRRGDVPDVKHVWILTSDPNGRQIYPWHEVIDLRAGQEQDAEDPGHESGVEPGRW